MRKITSIILAITFVIVSVTGIQMAMGSTNKRPAIKSQITESNAIASSDVNVSRKAPSFYPKKAHEWVGYIFIIAGITHIVFNFRPMVSYIKKRS